MSVAMWCGATRDVSADTACPLFLVYVLAGIVGAGFLLGGAGKPSQRKMEKVKAEINEKVQEARREALPLLPDTELAALVAKAEIALKEGSVSPFGVPAKGRAGKAFGDLKQ